MRYSRNHPVAFGATPPKLGGEFLRKRFPPQTRRGVTPRIFIVSGAPQAHGRLGGELQDRAILKGVFGRERESRFDLAAFENPCGHVFTEYRPVFEAVS